MVRIVNALILSSLVTTASGCGLSLQLYGSTWLNPRLPADSKSVQKQPARLEVLAYQLTAVPPEQQQTLINQVNDSWTQLGESWLALPIKQNFPEPIKPYLAYPPTESKRPTEHFIIEPRSTHQVELPRRFATSHILVITLGVERTERSVRLFNVGLTDSTIPLCFHEYEVFTADGGPWHCQTN